MARQVRERLALGDLNLEPDKNANPETLKTYVATWLESVDSTLKTSTV